ncbi:MAG: hypothetical protein FJZ90_02525 [Chloroflexi bacterium]|nr:hypothetical protein [Chloroflexota bacterium]
MNLKSLRIGEAFGLVMRTMPVLLVRLGVSLLFWVVSLVYLGIAGGIAWLVGQAVPFLGVILFIAALVGVGPLYKLAQRYVFYIIKAAHVAVISELLVSGQLPAGVSQLQWGKERVQERFGEASVMFVIDEMVSGIIRAFTNTVYRVASWLPGDALRGLGQVIGRVIRYALDYVDEAILARAFWLRGESVWATARDGVVLYGMVWKPLLLNAVALMFLSYVPFLIVLILFAAPVGFLLSLISTQVGGWSIIATLVLAFLVKVAVGDSFAMTAMIAAYQRETAGLEPDPAMSARLEGVSSKFGELKQRAEQEVSKLGRSRASAESEAEPM